MIKLIRSACVPGYRAAETQAAVASKKEVWIVTRFAPVVAVGVPHHVTQRGNTRQVILEGEADCKVYMELPQQSLELYRLALLGYFLMSNHVHLTMFPAKADALSRALKDTHGRYASYWNATHQLSRQVWQVRFYS
jgi:putative transposase